jgi:adiponectin receptor
MQTCCDDDTKPITIFSYYPELETIHTLDCKKSDLHALAHDDNIYLKSGYRKLPVASFYRCIISMFTLHNDTCNIWTHFLPGLYFLYATYTTNLELIEWNVPLEDRIYFSFFSLCSAITMLVSAVYHVFRHRSVHVYHFCLTCDLRGIVLLLCGGNTLCIAMALKSYPHLRSIIQTINFISFTVLTMWISTCVKNRLGKQRTIYFALYSMLAAVSCITRPVLLTLSEKSQTLVNNSFYATYFDACYDHFSNLLIVYILFGGGLVLFALKFPERYFPYKFDLFGASHQLFHIFVVMGSYFALSTMMTMYKQGAFPNVQD